MINNLIILATKKKVWCCQIHSNHHHLKVVKNIVDHFRYNFLGGDVGRKNNITPKELMVKIKNNNNPSDYVDWWEYEGLRKLGFNDNYSGYIIIDATNDEWKSREIYMNLATSELDSDEIQRMVYSQFKYHFKEVLKEVK